MASSKVAVCNMALSELGEKSITSLSDATDRARLCNQLFNDVVRLVLREHDWNCARKRVALSMLEEAPEYEFAHQYELPADWIRTVSTNLDTPGDDWFGYKWVEEDGKILTDAETLKIKYIYFLDNPVKWDSQLTDCVSAQLSYRLTYGITGKSGYKQAMKQLYDERLSTAKGVNGIAGTPEELDMPVLIEARRQ